MIFVTVGTHEQQFNRLIKEVDLLKANNIIQEDVFIQSGYSDYTPKYCNHDKLISYNKMEQYVKEASIIITHGGPGSIMFALSYGKVPIVVPRQEKYKEHIDNHQILFTQRLEKEKRILAIYDIKKLGEYIKNYNELVSSLNKSSQQSNLNSFIDRLNQISYELLKK